MDFSSMSGWDFEHYCADCLLKKGFTKAEVTSGSGDHGVDIIAEQNGIRFGIQCKLYQGQISNKAVQEAYTGASYYDCDVAVIMSNSELTKQAQIEAKKLRVKFWNVSEYIPKPEKKSSEINTVSAAVNINYNWYIDRRASQLTVLENKVIKSANKRSDWWMSEKAIQWLLCGKNLSEPLNWYPLVKSIESFLLDIQNTSASYDGSKLLFKKLCFTSTIVNISRDIASLLSSERYEVYVSTVCESLNYQLPKDCGDAKNVAYKFLLWDLICSLELYQSAIESIGKLFNCFSDAELIRTINETSSLWDYQTVACEIPKDCLKSLFHSFEKMVQSSNRILKRVSRVSKINTYKMRELQTKSQESQKIQADIKNRFEQAESRYNDLLGRTLKTNRGSSDIIGWVSKKGISLTGSSSISSKTINLRMLLDKGNDPIAIVLGNNQPVKNVLICYYLLYRNLTEKNEENLIQMIQEKMDEELAEPQKELQRNQILQTSMGKKSSKNLGITDIITAINKQIKKVQDGCQKSIVITKKSAQKELDYLYAQILKEAEKGGVREAVLNRI